MSGLIEPYLATSFAECTDDRGSPTHECTKFAPIVVCEYDEKHLNGFDPKLSAKLKNMGVEIELVTEEDHEFIGSMYDELIEKLDFDTFHNTNDIYRHVVTKRCKKTLLMSSSAPTRAQLISCSRFIDHPWQEY